MPRRGASGAEAVTLPGFTDNLNRILAAYAWLDDRGRVTTYTTASLTARLRALGYDYSDVYLRQMRTGQRANPSAVLLLGLSRAFGGLDIRVWFPEEYPEVHAAALRELDRQGDALREATNP